MNSKDPITIDFDLWLKSLDFVRTNNKKLEDFARKHNDRIVWYEDVKTNKVTDRVKNPDKKYRIKNIDELKEHYYLVKKYKKTIDIS